MRDLRAAVDRCMCQGRLGRPCQSKAAGRQPAWQLVVMRALERGQWSDWADQSLLSGAMDGCACTTKNNSAKRMSYRSSRNANEARDRRNRVSVGE
jgi:hypothetical protein